VNKGFWVIDISNSFVSSDIWQENIPRCWHGDKATLNRHICKYVCIQTSTDPINPS